MSLRGIVALGFLSAGISLQAQQQGIHVGQPKVYDTRTLTLMLEELNAQLTRVSVVDQAKLAAAIGALQGIEVRESSAGVTASLIRPYNTSKTEGDKVTTTETVPEPKIPWNMDLGTFAPIGPSSPNYGVAAQDLLGEQVNLQYQIFNLRMLLDRSLTDRIAGNQTKLSAVIGVPISLDPPRQALDSAAIVTVRVIRRPKEGESSKYGEVSLIAQMPQEKTFNAAALSRKSNAFGAAAVAKVVHVGFSSIKRGQTYFLYRDTDTIALEGRDEHGPFFGWQFRPVLGRRSVSAGKRQMFAVVALPDADEGDDQFPVDVEVTTRWVKYQRAQQTTDARSKWHGQAWPLLVPTTGFYQNRLKPEITSASWQSVGKKEVIVSVQGHNFFSDTKLIMGGKTFDASNGLRIKSEQAFDLVIDGVQFSDAVIQGRYGPVAPLMLRPDPRNGSLCIEEIDWRLAVDEHSRVDVWLRDRFGKGLEVADLPRSPPGIGNLLLPQITFNGVLLPQPYQFRDEKRFDLPSVVIRLWVPTDLVKKRDGVLSVRYPFWGDLWFDSLEVEDPDKYYSLTRISKDAEIFLVRNKLRSFTENNDLVARLASGKTIKLSTAATCSADTVDSSFCFLDRDSAILTVKDETLSGKLLLVDTKLELAQAVDVPAKESAASTAAAMKPTPTEVNQFDSVWFTLDLTKETVKKVEADGQELRVRPNDKKLDVFLPRTLTQKPGDMDLLITSPGAEGKEDTTRVLRIQIVCRECKAAATSKEKEN